MVTSSAEFLAHNILNELRRLGNLPPIAGGAPYSLDFSLENIFLILQNMQSLSSEGGILVAASDAPNAIKSQAAYTADGTDDDVQIQAALDSLGSVGGKVILSPGTFVVGSPIVLSSRQSLIGSGFSSTVIKAKNNLNNNVIESAGIATALDSNSNTNAIFDVTIRDLAIDGHKSNQTSGWCVQKYGYRWRFERVWVHHGKDGNVYSEWGRSASVGVPEGGMEDQWSNFLIDRSDGYGVHWLGPHDSQFINGFIERNASLSGAGTLFESTANSDGSACKFTNVHWWGNKDTAIGADFRCLAYLYNCQFEGNSGVGGIGLKTSDSTDKGYIQAVGCHWFGNNVGLLLAGNDRSSIDGVFTSHTANDGVAIELGITAGQAAFGNAINARFQNNKVAIKFTNSSGRNRIVATALQLGSGQVVNSGNPHTNDRLIVDNTASNTGTVYYSNLGGTGSIPSGSTSVVITHGLGRTPLTRQISIVGTNNPTADPGHVWISNLTSTQFIVNCKNDPSTSGFSFAWYANGD